MANRKMVNARREPIKKQSGDRQHICDALERRIMEGSLVAEPSNYFHGVIERIKNILRLKT